MGPVYRSMIANFFKLLTSTSIFIALNGMLVSMFSSLLYGIELKMEIMLVAFLMTLSIYSLNKVTDKAEDSINRPETASKGPLRYTVPSIASMVFSLAIGVWKGAFPVIVVPVIIAMAYSLRLSKSIPRLKEIVGVKSLLVAFSWAFTGTLLPSSTGTIALEKMTLTFIYIFILLLVNTTIFDILDMDGDRFSGVKTIPIVLGVNKTKKILIAVNSLLVPWLAYCVAMKMFTNYAPALLFGTIYDYAIIGAFSRSDRNRTVAEAAVDGEWIPILALMILKRLF